MYVCVTSVWPQFELCAVNVTLQLLPLPSTDSLAATVSICFDQQMEKKNKTEKYIVKIKIVLFFYFQS